MAAADIAVVDVGSAAAGDDAAVWRTVELLLAQSAAAAAVDGDCNDGHIGDAAAAANAGAHTADLQHVLIVAGAAVAAAAVQIAVLQRRLTVAAAETAVAAAAADA